MDIMESGSAIKGPYKDFNNISYSTSALKNKYREYKKKKAWPDVAISNLKQYGA